MGEAYLPIFGGQSGVKVTKYTLDGSETLSTDANTMTEVCSLPKNCCIILSIYTAGKVVKYSDGSSEYLGPLGATSNVFYSTYGGVLSVRHTLSSYTKYSLYVYIIEPE